MMMMISYADIALNVIVMCLITKKRSRWWSWSWLWLSQWPPSAAHNKADRDAWVGLVASNAPPPVGCQRLPEVARWPQSLLHNSCWQARILSILLCQEVCCWRLNYIYIAHSPSPYLLEYKHMYILSIMQFYPKIVHFRGKISGGWVATVRRMHWTS